MKHHLLTAIIMALTLVPATLFAQFFSEVNEDGVTIYYDTGKDNTCKVVQGPIHGYSGHISIPPYAAGLKVTAIEAYAFECCENLLSVIIPNTVTSIGEYAFDGCSGLESITIGENVEEICWGAFSRCTSLSSINLPNSVKHLGSEVFINCYNLKSIVLPNSLTYISDYAFHNCTSLESIDIPNSVTSIAAYAFQNCTSLTSVTIGESVQEIDSYAFDGCEKLTKLNIPNSNIHFAMGALEGNPWWESYSSNTENHYGNIIYINDVAYKAVSSTINELQFRENTIEICERAFYRCKNIKSVTIPSSVISIGNSAFSDCKSLKTVYSEITNFFDIDRSVFSGSSNTTLQVPETLYVPKGMATTYRSSKGWSVIKHIEEMPDDTPDASFLISCSGKGSVFINGEPGITNKISAANINEGTDNTFNFTPKPGCRLDQVILNGLDITANVEGNTLTCIIPANSQMIVTFSSEQGDMNNDGTIDISDVVSIVNKILGN